MNASDGDGVRPKAGDSTMPLVSIGLPVYNGDDFIAKALESLLSQSFTNFEIIISDNASTDRTEQICLDFAARDSRIQYHRNERNIGASANYNRTFMLSRGKYFKWAAHDDMCAPTHLAKCVKLLENSSEDVVLCFPKTMLVDTNGKSLGTYHHDLELMHSTADRRFGHLLRNLKKCNSVHGLIRSDALKTTRLLGNYFAADVVLLAELALCGKMKKIHEPLFYRRMHPRSSRTLNKSYEDVAVWFDPSNKGRIILPVTNLFIELFRATNRSYLPWYAKFGCLVALAEEWLSRYWRVMGGEMKLLSKTLFQRHLLDRRRRPAELEGYQETVKVCVEKREQAQVPTKFVAN